MKPRGNEPARNREADDEVPGSSAHLRVLLRRLAPTLGLSHRTLSAALRDPPEDQRARVDALRAVARAARRVRATAIDASPAPDALLVAIDGADPAATPVEFRRADALVAAAFGTPLRVQNSRWIAVPPAPPESPAVPAAASLARAYFSRVRAMEPETLIDEDPEGAHQLRVGVRRMRVALRLLEREVPTPSIEAVVNAARALGAAAGAVRDCDVSRTVLADLLGEAAVRDAAIHAVDRRRAAAITELGPALSSPDAEARRAAAERTLDTLARSGAEGRSLEQAAQAHFERELRRLRRRIDADLSTPAAFHDVRRQLRRVRDAAEVFSTSLRKSQREQRAKLQPVQALLGRLNDLDVADALLSRADGELIARARNDVRRARFEVMAQSAVPLALLATRLARRAD